MFNFRAFNPAALQEIGASGGGNMPPSNTGFGGGRMQAGGMIPQMGSMPPPGGGFLSQMVGGNANPMFGNRPQMGMGNMGASRKGPQQKLNPGQRRMA